MILNELVLQNVGTFGDRHAIDLTPSSTSKPVVLIGGLNGVGKTTILESIQLALYGSLAHGSGRRAGSYENYLRGLVHRRAPAGAESVVELTFTARQEGEEHVYRLNRSWQRAGESVRETLLVFVDGRYDQTLSSTWSEHVETFLPRGISGLFFFDGEQIEALADMERSRQVLGAALAALLGLDLVERLSTDLTVLKRRRRGEQAPDSLRQSVEDQKRLVTAHRQAEETAVEAEAARRTEMERCQKLLFEATEAYRSAGGDLLDQREVAETRAADLKAGLARCEDELREDLARMSPLLQVGALLDQLLERSRLEASAKRDALVAEEFATRDDALLQRLKSVKAGRGIFEAVEQFLAEDRERRRLIAETEELVGDVDPAAVEGLLNAALPSSRERIQAMLVQRSSMRSELDQAERVLAAVPDPDSLAPLRRRREEAQDSLLRAEAALEAVSALLQATRADRAKAHDAYESALDKAAQANLAADDDRRMVEHIDRVKATLEELRTTATRRHLEHIAQLVLEALRTLLRKERLITDVRIDPERYTVSLIGVDGRTLPAADLSAGERQLLSVALLWGLARAAGRPLPVVVDTPLGRLDGSHRRHLLDRYFPRASHQVVLLATDTEIDEAAYARLAPWIGRAYHLEFDQAVDATRVVDGYFWEGA